MTSLLPERGMIRHWVDAYKDFSEAPDEAHLATAIATISAGVGWKAPVSFVEGSDEPCTISVILEGRSAAAKKTTTANIARRLVSHATQDMDAELQTMHVHVVSHTSGRGIIEMISAKDEAQAREWDKSPPPGHLVMWDEFGSLLGDPGQSRKGGDWHGQIRTTLLQVTNGWHGGSKTGSFKAPASRVAVAVIATMTRVELEQRVDSTLFRDGFMGRFMIIPHGSSGRYIAVPKTPDAEVVNARIELQDWLGALAMRRMEFGNPFSFMTPEALDRRAQWYYALKFKLEEATESDPGDALKSAEYEVFNRLQTAQVKLAMIQAVAEMPKSQMLTGVPTITAEHLAWAEGVVTLSMDEMIDLARTSKTPEDHYMDRVLAYLRNAGTPVIRGTILDNCTSSGLPRVKRWQVIMDMVKEDVLAYGNEVGPNGGRPKETVWVRETTNGKGVS